MDTLREELEFEVERSADSPQALIGLAVDFVEGLSDKKRARELIAQALNLMKEEPYPAADWRVLINASDILVQDIALIERVTKAFLAASPPGVSIVELADAVHGLWRSPMYGKESSDKLKRIYSKIFERASDEFRKDFLGTDAFFSICLLIDLLVRVPTLNRVGAIEQTNEILKLATDHANSIRNDPGLWSNIAECYAHCNQPEKADQVFLKVTEAFENSEIDEEFYDLYKMDLAFGKHFLRGVPETLDLGDAQPPVLEERYKIGPQTWYEIGLRTAK